MRLGNSWCCIYLEGCTIDPNPMQDDSDAARAIAERKTLGHLSYRVATRRQSFNLPNMISIRLRRL